MAEPVFIHQNIYGINNNPILGGGIRAIGGEYSIINDTTIHLFIEPYRYGIKDNSGNVLLIGEGCTKALKSHYSYNICVHKNTKNIYIFVESGVNIPFYLPLARLEG